MARFLTEYSWVLDLFFRSAIVGLGACAILDLWSLLVSLYLRTPKPDFTMMGRWLLHHFQGRFAHESIAASPALPQERPAGWAFHYAVGWLFAVVTMWIGGPQWAQSPTLWPAMLVGWVTVGLGWFWLQPAMGLGFAGAKTPNPARVRLLGLLGHTVFGLAMFAIAWAIRGI